MNPDTTKNKAAGTGYRYPGSRPFYDTDIDRKLFFGREIEKESLLHKVLADDLVVLYAKSGLGKSSLMDAGLNQALRERKFVPLKIRFNNPGLDPVKQFYEEIENCVEHNGLDYEPGEKESLWQYFKTAAFWSSEDTLLKPVLVLDQFEEFFTLHSREARQPFTRQLADLAGNNIPRELQESIKPGEPLPYSEEPSDVKVIISIREDFLGHLEEMSRRIPGILQNRFRLLPLSREQAEQAIIEPSLVQDEAIDTASFSYSRDTVNMMLDFLCKRKEKDGIKITDEVESFQLQLLCKHIEDKVKERVGKKQGNIVVKKDDLGGEQGMYRILQRFYDHQLNRLGHARKKRRIRKLCEKGLISVADRRLSLEEDEIKRRYRVPGNLLAELVNYRLLRSESRVGSIYYELSHDTLVAPIRESQKKRKSKRNTVAGIFLIVVLIVLGYLINPPDRSNSVGKKNSISQGIGGSKSNGQIVPTNARDYNNLGEALLYQGKYKEAIEKYEKAVEIDPENARSHNDWGYALLKQKKYKEAIKKLKKAIKIDPYYAHPYINWGDVLYYQEKYNEAIEKYKIAIEIDPMIAVAYNNMGYVLCEMGKYNEAIENCKKAIEIDPKDALTYNNWGYALREQKKYNEAIEKYKKAIKIDPNYSNAYNEWGYALGEQKKYNEAIEIYKIAIEIDPKLAQAYGNMGYVLRKLGKYNEAIEIYKEAIKIDPNYSNAYNGWGHALRKQKKYNEAIKKFKKAIQVDPEEIGFKINLTVANLFSERFNTASTRADDLLKENNLTTEDILIARFLSISSLLFQGKQTEAEIKLKEFIYDYRSHKKDNKRKWLYEDIKDFINNDKKLPQGQPQLLLQLIDSLESPKSGRDKKIKELENLIEK
jgi:tetratricopeptide (TPR) repeat protein